MLDKYSERWGIASGPRSQSPPKDVFAEYQELNLLGKILTFASADDYVLRECIAIAMAI